MRKRMICSFGVFEKTRHTSLSFAATIELGILDPYPAALLAQHSYRLPGQVAASQQLASTIH
jgi:hypothetical protein